MNVEDVDFEKLRGLVKDNKIFIDEVGLEGSIADLNSFAVALVESGVLVGDYLSLNSYTHFPEGSKVPELRWYVEGKTHGGPKFIEVT